MSNGIQRDDQVDGVPADERALRMRVATQQPQGPRALNPNRWHAHHRTAIPSG